MRCKGFIVAGAVGLLFAVGAPQEAAASPLTDILGSTQITTELAKKPDQVKPPKQDKFDHKQPKKDDRFDKHDKKKPPKDKKHDKKDKKHKKDDKKQPPRW